MTDFICNERSESIEVDLRLSIGIVSGLGRTVELLIKKQFRSVHLRPLVQYSPLRQGQLFCFIWVSIFLNLTIWYNSLT